MTGATAPRTAWTRNLAAPLRDYLNTETGGAAVLFAATVAALIWAKSPWSRDLREETAAITAVNGRPA